MSLIESIGQSLIYGILVGALYGLAASGLSLVFGVMSYLNVAHGALIMIGTYVAYSLFSTFQLDPFLSIPVVMIILFLIGMFLYRLMFAGLAKYPMSTRIDNSLLISFGLMLVLESLANLVWSPDERNITASYSGVTFGFMGLRVPYVGLLGLVTTAVLILALHLLLVKTYFGKSVRAASQDWESAVTVGVNIERTYFLSFAVGIALAGAAGSILSASYSFSPAISEGWSIKALIVLTLAGLGRIGGVFAAGLVLGIVEAVSVYFIGASYQQVVGLVLFILLLMFRPQGLFAKKERVAGGSSESSTSLSYAFSHRISISEGWSFGSIKKTLTTMKFLMVLALAMVLGLLPLIVTSDYLINIFILTFLYITITQSWNILGGYTGQISIGQSAFFGIGALSTRLLWMSGVPIVVSLLAGGISAALLAALIGLPSLRLRGVYFAIGTLGLAIITGVIVHNIFPGVSFLPAKYLDSFTLTPRYYVAFVVTLVTIAAAYFLVNSRLGIGMLAVKEDEAAAASTGVNTFKCRVLALAVSTFLAGLAGGVYAFYSAVYYYFVPFELIWSFEPVLIAIIGGAGTIVGPVWGAVAYVALKELFAVTIGQFSVPIFGALFIITIISLPGGLVEAAARLKTFFRSYRMGNPDCLQERGR
jgi:ABC-type branched-subunit amino acid transport system permease subunit